MQEATPHPPRIGLALSGGTAKVIAHLGVLRALDEAGLRPHRLVGTSGGALIAVLYASGRPLPELIEIARTVNWRRLVRIHLPKLGLLSSESLEIFVRDTLGDLSFEDLTIPTEVVTTNLLTGEKTVFSSGPIAPVVRASCSIPQIFAPVEIDGGLYTDGGVIEYLPLPTLREHECDVYVGVHLGAYLDFSEPPAHILGMIMRVIGLVASHNAQHAVRFADVLIKPDMRGFGGFDLTRALELVQIGYEAGLAAIPQIRECLEPSQSGRWNPLPDSALSSGQTPELSS